MSLPTRIYLVLVTVAFGAWLGWTFIGGGFGPARAKGYATDPEYFIRHAKDLTESLRGRVSVGDGTGGRAQVPEGALFARIEARDLDGRIAVQRLGAVDRFGVFEVGGLPLGTATVSIEMGAGGVLARLDDIVVDDSIWRSDPRIDPIDLGGAVAPFDVEVVGVDGMPAEDGHVAWRPAALFLSDEAPMLGLAPVKGGVARFLTTTDRIDVVAFVPGARQTLFEAVAAGERLQLDRGATIDLVVGGVRPDPSEWQVLAHVERIGADPDGPLLENGAFQLPTHRTAELDADGHAFFPVLDGGPFRLTWFISKTRKRITGTIRIDDPVGPIEIADTGGAQPVTRDFPMGEFLSRLSARE